MVMFKSRRRPIIIPQSEHLRLAGTLAYLWGNQDFDFPSINRTSLVGGVSLHDRGYGILDNSPVGEMPKLEWVEITRRGFYMPGSDAAGDLIVKHHLLRLTSSDKLDIVVDLHAEFEHVVADLIEKVPTKSIGTGQFVIGAINHSTFVSRGTCWSSGCHTAVHGSDINHHLLY